MTAALLSGDGELTATQVITRVFGVGLLEADIMLSNVSIQDRGRIVEAYNAGRTNEIYSILDTDAE